MNPPPRFSAPSRTVDGRFTDVQSHQAEDESESYMALTKKQIKQLKALAHHLNPIIQVGKNDLSDAAVKQAGETIEEARAHQVRCAGRLRSDCQGGPARSWPERLGCRACAGDRQPVRAVPRLAPRRYREDQRSLALNRPYMIPAGGRRHPYNADGPNRRKRRTLRIRRSYPKLRQLLADGQHLAVGPRCAVPWFWPCRAPLRPWHTRPPGKPPVHAPQCACRCRSRPRRRR